jgi:hypothetical protein
MALCDFYDNQGRPRINPKQVSLKKFARQILALHKSGSLSGSNLRNALVESVGLNSGDIMLIPSETWSAWAGAFSHKITASPNYNREVSEELQIVELCDEIRTKSDMLPDGFVWISTGVDIWN